MSERGLKVVGEKGPQEGKRKTRKWLQAGNLASGGGGFSDKRKKRRGAGGIRTGLTATNGCFR